MTEPSYRPVSEALDLDRLLAGTRDEDAGKALHTAVAHALNVLDRVHVDGIMPRIPVELLPDHDLAEGAYDYKGDRAFAIRLRLGADEPHLTVLHEIGHFLDHIGVGGNPFAFSSKRDARFADWRAAAYATGAARTFRDMAGLTQHERWHHQYLLRPNELWARSYAQYVGVTSQDSVLLEELNRIRARLPGEVYLPYYWEDGDFSPVFLAIDELLRRMGWLI